MSEHAKSPRAAALPRVVDPAAIETARAASVPLRLVDVRTPMEFAGGHVAGSVNVPLHELADRVGELRASDAPVVLVCRSGARACTAERQLLAAGVRRVHVLDGGMLAWRRAGLPVEGGATRLGGRALVLAVVALAAVVVAAVAAGAW